MENSNVNPYIFILKYHKTDVNDISPDDFGYNLRLIFNYLNAHSNEPDSKDNGGASRMIKAKCRQMYGKRFLFSKREIRSLCYMRNGKDSKYAVWIPYRAEYIFRVIFMLVDNLQNEGYPLSKNLKQFIGKIRRDCFYSYQCALYDNEYRHTNNRTPNEDGLYDDLFDDGYSLSKKF